LEGLGTLWVPLQTSRSAGDHVTRIVNLNGFINHFLTRDNHSIWHGARICINAQLLVSVAEKRRRLALGHRYGFLMRSAVRAKKAAIMVYVP
jgi:hypothetical protein